MNSHKKENYDLLDLIKFILAVLIVAIHSSLLTTYLYPWLRIAVPLFFTISSYLFFKKIGTCEDLREKNKALVRFIFKNLKLLAIWTTILFPIILYAQRRYLFEGITGILKLFKNFLFGETFTGGWFIVALVEAVAIVFFLSKKLKSKTIFIICLLLNAVSIFISSYMRIFSDVTAISNGYKYIELIFTNPVFSFFTAMLWVFVGKIYAEHKFSLKMRWYIIFAVVSAVMLYLEWRMLFEYTDRHKNDCYVFLIPLCISLFAIIEHYKSVKIPNSNFLRKGSTIMYVVHGAVIAVVGFLFRKLIGDVHEIFTFLITIAVSIILTITISCLEKYNRLKWLKELY